MRNRFLLPSLLLSIGLFFGLYFLGAQIYKMKTADRFVTVKGLAEQEVKADKGSWVLRSEFGGASGEALKSKAKGQLQAIKDFLLDKGFEEEEISVEEFSLRQNLYANNGMLFIASIQVSVFTEKVDLLESIASNVNELMDKGVTLSGDRWSMRPRYYFTRINDIKPELLQKSTKAAQFSAEEFAANSGAKVGAIKNARQGIISLIPSNRVAESQEFYKMKIARVVSTMEYYIE